MRPFTFWFSVVSGLVAAAPLSANPEGGQVVSGAAGISSSGKVLTVNQSTDKAIIQWQSFENTATETIQFQQPSATSVTLNRVVGVNPSFIGGTMTANGRIFLLNPNGIVFGPQSQVNVGSLVASTLGISDSDFLSGNYRLVQDGARELSSIVNQGKIAVAAGGTVALVAPMIDNSGEIVALAGRVFLVAGKDVTLQTDLSDSTLNQVNNAGGAVRMPQIGFSQLLESVVNISSVSVAAKIVRLDDGTVFLRGSEGILLNAGQIRVDNDSSIAQAPGRVRLDATHSIALGPGSRVSAVDTDTGSASGPIAIRSTKGSVYYTRLEGDAHAPATIEGDDVNVRAARAILSDSEKSLQLTGRVVDLEATAQLGLTRIGRPGEPVRVTAGNLRATTATGESVVLDVVGDTTINQIKAGADSGAGYTSTVIFNSSGDVFQQPGGSTGIFGNVVRVTTTGQVGVGEIVVPDPDGPAPGDPDVSQFVKIGGQDVQVNGQQITSSPIGGNFFLKLNFGGQSPGSANDVAADIGSISQPVARSSYSPPVDGIDVDVPAGDSSTLLGSADNSLQATLRNERVRGRGDSSRDDGATASDGSLIEVEQEGDELDGEEDEDDEESDTTDRR